MSLGHYVEFLCIRSEKNPKSNEGGRRNKKNIGHISTEVIEGDEIEKNF